MKIAIIVPAYQEGDDIIGFLESLINTQPIDQCVIIDASERADYERIKSKVTERFDEPLVSFLAATKKGRAHQMNFGAANSQSACLLFLHADTTLPSAALNQIREGIALGWHWGHFDVVFDNPRWPYRLIASMMNWRSRKTGITTGDQAMFMTRAAFDIVGGFDEIPLMEDIALSKKLKRLGAPLYLSTCVRTSARRWEQQGVVKTIVLMWWLRLAYWLGVSPARLATWYR